MALGELRDRWLRISDRANTLHYNAPWIYSDTWLSMFMDETDEAWDSEDLDNLNKVITKWEKELG